MKNNGKPSETKENEKKMKLQMKKTENLDSKLQILTRRAHTQTLPAL